MELRLLALLVLMLLAAFADDATAQLQAKQPVDCSTLTGKVMCGYQGWFNCPGDGSKLGWVHWGRSPKQFGPDSVTVDLWPDISELDSGEKYRTGFKHADGRIAETFSSANEKTVLRHFKWMQDYGIDGAFVQRFASTLNFEKQRQCRDRILNHCQKGAEKHGRAFAVMYDLSGMKRGALDQVVDDWQQLCNVSKITQSDAYLHHKGKPLVAIWGVGFRERHEEENSYSLADCKTLIEAIKRSGSSVMLGVPTGWRNLDRDCLADKAVNQVLALADVISPWTPGRYQSPAEAKKHGELCWSPDLKKCHELGQSYMPVIYPGFSWYNLKKGVDQLGAVPRLKGKFLWSQIVAAKKAGAEMIYVAMFDEVDEGTAIFKCTNDPPVGEGVRFLGMEGLPSDFYLRMVGHAGKVIRDEATASPEMPDFLAVTSEKLMGKCPANSGIPRGPRE